MIMRPPVLAAVLHSACWKALQELVVYVASAYLTEANTGCHPTGVFCEPPREAGDGKRGTVRPLWVKGDLLDILSHVAPPSPGYPQAVG